MDGRCIRNSGINRHRRGSLPRDLVHAVAEVLYSRLLDALWQQVRDQVPQQPILLERPDPRRRCQGAKHILNPEMRLAYITPLTPVSVTGRIKHTHHHLGSQTAPQKRGPQ